MTDLARIQALFATEHWHFAKSMPEIPHHYTRRREWADEEEFVWVVQFIRDHGGKEYFAGRPYIYLYLDGWKYWSMASPITDTKLINRAKA